MLHWKKKKKDVRQPVFWWCLVDAYIENKVLRESVKSIKHIFMARVSLTKNLQFWEMLQPPDGWQSSLTEKGKLLSNQHAAKFCWRLFLKWRFYFNSYLGLYNGSVSTWEIGKAQYVWEKLNTQIRDVCLAIQIKNNSHFRFLSLFSFQKRLFWPKFSQLARKMSLNQFLLFFFLLKKRKSVYSSFQREIPCSRPLTVFFFFKNAFIDQSSVN